MTSYFSSLGTWPVETGSYAQIRVASFNGITYGLLTTTTAGIMASLATFGKRRRGRGRGKGVTDGHHGDHLGNRGTDG